MTIGGRRHRLRAQGPSRGLSLGWCESLDLKADMGRYVSGLGQPPFDPRMIRMRFLRGKL